MATLLPQNCATVPVRSGSLAANARGESRSMHELTFDYRDGFLIARCACGGWERQAPVGSGELGPTVVALDWLERAYRRHASPKAPPPAGEGTSPA